MKFKLDKPEDKAQQESERQLRLLTDAAPVMIWISGPDMLRTYFNKRWLDFTGRSLESEIGNGWIQGIHPDDRQGCMAQFNERCDLRQELTMEYRLHRHDGEYRHMIDNGIPRYSVDGPFVGYMGTCVDLTESKRADEVLSSMNARLIRVQEEERTRIARELHDDIGASIAILGIELLRAGQPVSGSPGRMHPGIPAIYEKMQGIASKVTRMSHKLHSPALEYFGLVEAIQIECREFSARFKIPVECSFHDVPAKLDQAVGLSFFRVVQEALHNAAKHSGAAKIEVKMTLSSSLLTLIVRDNGRGFDVEQSRLAAGLGLISMRERMRLVGGDFSINSQPGQGTELICQVPQGEPPQASR